MNSYPDSTSAGKEDIPAGTGARIKYFREQAFMNIGDLAEKAGLTPRTIQNIEKDPEWPTSESSLVRIAKALEVPIAELREASPNQVPSVPPPVNRRGLFTFFAVAVISLFGLVTYSLVNAEWALVDEHLEVRDRLANVLIWRFESEATVSHCIEAPWDSQVLLVGLSATAADGGRVVACNRLTGKQHWEVKPEIQQLRDAFGTELVNKAHFGVDLLGPWRRSVAEDEIAVVTFYHGKYYPTAICAFNENGELLHQYNFKGQVTEYTTADLDDDGLVEIIVAGTNNARAYMGGMITVLNRDHFAGASVDALAPPVEAMSDSSVYRVIFPAYQDPWMEQMSSVRLHAQKIQVLSGPGDEISLSITVGQDLMERTIVYLDSNLVPTQCDIYDSFREALESWPDSLTNGKGPGDGEWRAEWLAGHYRFEVGRLVE